QAWVTKSVFSIRPYIKVPKNKYFEGIKPLIILQRTLGRFPYSFNKHGFNPFKLLSFTTLYTVVFFSVQSAWTIYTMFVIAKLKIYNAPSYDEVLYWISIGLLLLLNFTTPITKWIDARRHVQFVNSWQDFQVNYMKCELQMTLAQPIKIIAILILPAALVFMILETYLLNNLPFLVILPFVSAISAASTTLIHWCVTLYELRVVSRHLLSKIIMNGCRQMSRYRRTWLELSKLVSAVGEAHAYTGMMMSVIFFISIILSTYTILSSLFESETVSNNVWGLIMGAIIGFLCNFILYDAAYRTTQEVGPNFSSKILNLDLTHLSQGEINEVKEIYFVIDSNNVSTSTTDRVPRFCNY
ncbi:unnamed protein product, partial [Nezara viridula]